MGLVNDDMASHLLFAEWIETRVGDTPELVADGAGLFAIELSSYWLDIGTPASLLQGNLDALSGAYKSDAVPEPGPGACAIAGSAEVADDASVTATAVGGSPASEESSRSAGRARRRT